MGLLTNRVERNEIKLGDHIYTYRAVFTYSHHGIYLGGSKVVHFRPERNLNLSTEASSDVYDSMSCPTFPDCGFRQPNSGVVLSCLDCFLKNGSLYCFEYGVSPSVFLAKYGVVHAPLQHLTPQKRLSTVQYKQGVGRSGQASSIIGAPLAAILSSPLKLLMPSPVGVATMTAGMYCMSRYATDIGVRTDVIKVAVEDLAVNLGWADDNEEEVTQVEESSMTQITR
ncbi:unnamed protein product [Prunus armeniaca]|uniref:LRAT domain-containing protein n=1 Tax=Prunus armeniaca TaxID=36596 RepID=A0A6J5U7A1_PRUAR|nr:unnamed protein product [Prunus armeniaca]